MSAPGTLHRHNDQPAGVIVHAFIKISPILIGSFPDILTSTQFVFTVNGGATFSKNPYKIRAIVRQRVEYINMPEC